MWKRLSTKVYVYEVGWKSERWELVIILVIFSLVFNSAQLKLSANMKELEMTFTTFLYLILVTNNIFVL